MNSITSTVTEFSAGYVTNVNATATLDQGVVKNDFMVIAYTYSYSGSVPASGDYNLSGTPTALALYFYQSPSDFKPSSPTSGIVYADTYAPKNTENYFNAQVAANQTVNINGVATTATTLQMSLDTSYWTSRGIYFKTGPPAVAAPMVVTLYNTSQMSDFGANYSAGFLPLPDTTTLNSYFTATQTASKLTPTGTLTWDPWGNTPSIDGNFYWTWQQGSPPPIFFSSVPEPSALIMGVMAIAMGAAGFYVSRRKQLRSISR